jgi:hypothetical protein
MLEGHPCSPRARAHRRPQPPHPFTRPPTPPPAPPQVRHRLLNVGWRGSLRPDHLLRVLQCVRLLTRDASLRHKLAAMGGVQVCGWREGGGIRGDKGVWEPWNWGTRGRCRVGGWVEGGRGEGVAACQASRAWRAWWAWRAWRAQQRDAARVHLAPGHGAGHGDERGSHVRGGRGRGSPGPAWPGHAC